MPWGVLILGVALSLIILIPLGIKWDIPRKITFIGPVVVGVFAGLTVSLVVRSYGLRSYQWLILLFLLITVMSASFLLWRFYRDPERIPPDEKNVILSPADGKIIYVKEIERGGISYSEKHGRKFMLSEFVQSEVFPSQGYLIGISMNFLNVHVNRAPMGGTISLMRHIKGGFLSLKIEEAVIQNERALTLIDNGLLKVGVVQIASRLVRSIVLYLQEGSVVRKGERIGMIRFGSQVDVILPPEPLLRIEVKPGESVKAGLSILARIVSDQGGRS